MGSSPQVQRESSAGRSPLNGFPGRAADLAPLGVYVTDAEGQCTYMNPRCCEIIGISRHEALGMGWSLAIHPEDRERVLAEWRERVDGRERFQQEYRFRGPDGRDVWVIDTAAVLYDEQGAPIGHIGGVTDVTELKRAELEISAANRALRTIVEASPVAILSLAPDGRVRAWNKGAERMFGWRAEEALDKVCPTVAEPDLADFHDMIARVLRGDSFEGEVRYRRRKGGEQIYALISAARLGAAAGAQDGVVVVLTDVTEREQDSAQLRTLIEERERLAQDLHDNCIQAIYGIGLQLEDCRRVILEDPSAAVLRIANAAAGLNVVIEDLRRSIHGEEPEIDEGETLEAALRRVISGFSDVEARFSVEIEGAAERALRAGTAAQLLHIAREAVSNSVRHAGARAACVSLRTIAGVVRFEVRDDGIGFDADRRWLSGGLGLHNMEFRARKLGARFNLRSAPGAGTQVALEFDAKVKQ